MALPTFPYTDVKALRAWSNFHGTIADKSIAVYCTPDVAGATGLDAPRKLMRHGQALRAIIAHCLSHDPPLSLRALGARWSLSNIIEPEHVAVDTAYLNTMLKVKPDWLADDYRDGRLAQGYVPMFIQGGTTINSINRRLADVGLALQTSGASDGHRIAGCIATGSHGAAIQIGAVHDTVLGVHLIVAEDKSVFVQPATAPACKDEVADWLQGQTGIACTSVRDDDLFDAAQVSLGGLGFVHAVILEAAPLYTLRGRTIVGPRDDAAIWAAIESMDTRPLHPDVPALPYHFQVVRSPYARADEDGAFVSLMWKEPVGTSTLTVPMPAVPGTSSDTMGLLGKLSEVLDGSLGTEIIKKVIAKQITDRYRPGDWPAAFPGHVFGPTGTAAGEGTSTEIVVDQADTRAAVQAIEGVLAEEALGGSLLLGAVALRFVPKTFALLGMNINPMNCYIELPSIRNAEVEHIYTRCWDALEQQAIAFTCHWGQVHGLSPARLRQYFGARVDQWIAARRAILTSNGTRRVFVNPLLDELELG